MSEEQAPKADVSGAKNWTPPVRGGGGPQSVLIGCCGYFRLGKPTEVTAGRSKKGNGMLTAVFNLPSGEFKGSQIVLRRAYTGQIEKGDRAGEDNINTLFEDLFKAGVSQEAINKLAAKGEVTGESLAKKCAKLDWYGFIGTQNYRGKISSEVKFTVSKSDYEDAVENGVAIQAHSDSDQAYYDKVKKGGGFASEETNTVDDDDDDF